MVENPEKRSVEQELRDLVRSLERYVAGSIQPTSQVVTDLGRAIRDVGEHLVNLHRRIEKLEADTPEWTTRGWTPPPGR